jgi:uncharacterized membrane protein YoaK (UPF0700 family)
MTPDTSPQPNSLTDAVLLATTGGMLDAVVYLNHGHVFANAMTGNVIFLAIAIIDRHWYDISRHVVPIIGFIGGVVASIHMRFRLGPRSVLVGLSFEIAALFLLGWLPIGFPQTAFTLIIAFVAAFQVASFRRVDRFAFNSTFLTGNLRDFVEGFYTTNLPSSTPEARERSHAQALDLGLICLCFFLGAIFGACAAPRFDNRSLWFAEPLLIAVAVKTLISPPTPVTPPSQNLH